MRELLIVKPSSLGDIVHALVAAQSIRDQLPSLRISWVVAERFAHLVEGCPTVNGEVFRYARAKGVRGVIDTCRALRQRRFDAVLDWQGLARSGLMTRAARTTRRIGRSDAREGASLAYTETTPLPPQGRESHAIAVLLEALPLLGLEPRVGSAVQLPTNDPTPLAPALSNSADSAPVVLVPNSRGTHKEWPHFLALAETLVHGPGNFPVVLDSHVAWETPAALNHPRFINLTTKTDLPTMTGLVAMARLVVVNDAGPLHIAAAMGTDVVGLFGPTHPSRFGPYPLDAPGHHVLEAPSGELAKLDVATVADAVYRALHRPRVPG